MENKESGKCSRKRPVTANEILETDFREAAPILSRGILPGGGGLILAGDSGVGKSLMRVEWSVLLAGGLPIYGLSTPSAQSVLVFQAENTIGQEQFRLRRLREGLDMERLPDRLFYAPPVWPCCIKEKSFLDYALDCIRQTAATVVFFDPLISYHSEPENDNVRIRSALDAFTHISRSTGCACILLHHFGKPSPESPQAMEYRMRGAQAIRDWADTAVTITPVKGLETEHYAYRRLDFIKIRNGPYHPPITLKRGKDFVHEVTEEIDGTPSGILVALVAQSGICRYDEPDLIQRLCDAARITKRLAQATIREAVSSGLIVEQIIDGTKRYRLRED